MSTTVDQRVVEMRFDNKQFESGVQTTMSTLDKLKQSLNLTGASKGLENVSSAASKVNLSGISSGVEAVSAKFSALQVMGVTALANITNSAINYGKKIANALTIEPVMTGFSEYETQINAVQTILANTESKGTKLPQVNAALDELNTYADKTIYNFTEMTRNIGTFTAAGVDLDKSVTSIKGIANLAAISGSTSQQASTAMYQLSQALAAGKVNLMDWNSVVNAGMGGQVFQDALKRTAKNMGTNVDAMIEKYGSFRESISKGEWLTADVLTETLSQLSGAYTEADLLAQGYTKSQAQEILKLAETGENAATKVKTFTQLWDTLKEAAQSGWTQTWEIIVGDFEEAKELLTKVSDVIGAMIGNSAKARNDLLQGWKDMGGRQALIDGLSNAFEGLMNIIKPIGDAFREIFPALKSEQLVSFTNSFKDLTASFADFTAKHGDQIKATFKGIFSVVDIGLSVIKSLAGGFATVVGHLLGFSGGILDTTASIGDWLSNIRDSIKETDIFGKAVEAVTGFIVNIITKIKEFGSSVRESFNSNGFSGFFNVFKSIWDFIVKVGNGISDTFSKLNFDGILGLLNGGLTAGILAGLMKFSNNLSSPLEAITGIFEKISDEDGLIDTFTGIFEGVGGCLESLQNQLKAGTLLKIASAIGILVGSIFVLSTIDTNSLYTALTAITVLFGELLGSLSIFSKISTGMSGVGKACGVMIAMSVAILILSSALKKISDIDMEGIGKGLIGIGGLMAELAIFLNTAKFDGKTMGTATGILILSAAMVVLSHAVENFSTMNWEGIGKGLAAIGGLLAELAIFTNLTGNASHVVSTGIALVAIAAAMKIFASAVQDMSQMSWAEIGRGLATMAGALLAVTVAVNLMPKNMVGMGIGLIAISAALTILANVIGKMGGMSWEEIGKGLATLGGAMLILAVGLNVMSGTLGGSAALLVAAAAIAVLTPSIVTLGNLSWEAIGKGLLTLAGAFTVLGIAGALLGPLVPAILALSGSLALIGVSVLAVGAGLTLVGAGLSAIAVGFTALTTSIAAGATAFVAALTVVITGIVGLIPTVLTQIGQGIIAICQVIADGAPVIAQAFVAIIGALVTAIVEAGPLIIDGFFVILQSLLDALVEYTPKIVVAAANIIVGFIEGISQKLPDVIQAAFDLILNFINGLTDAINTNTPLLVDAVEGLIMALINAALTILQGGVDIFASAGTAIMENGLIKGMISRVSSFLSSVGSIISKGLNYISKKNEEFKQAGIKLFTKLGEGIKSMGSKIATACGNLIKTAKTAITNKVSEWKTAGKNMIEGLISGIKSMAKSVVKAAKGVVNGAIEGAKKLLKINSPSKVFMGFGMGMDEGLILGLERFAGGVVKATEGVGSGAIDAMSNSLSSLSGMADGILNSDMQPTISPVLDLSNIEAGARNISGMFGMTPSVGVLANVGAISSTMNGYRQNGGNDDVVSAINKLRGALGNVGGNTYNINGVNYSEGSDVGDAFSALMRAIILEGRI